MRRWLVVGLGSGRVFDMMQQAARPRDGCRTELLPDFVRCLIQIHLRQVVFVIKKRTLRLPGIVETANPNAQQSDCQVLCRQAS